MVINFDDSQMAAIIVVITIIKLTELSVQYVFIKLKV